MPEAEARGVPRARGDLPNTQVALFFRLQSGGTATLPKGGSAPKNHAKHALRGPSPISRMWNVIEVRRGGLEIKRRPTQNKATYKLFRGAALG